MHFQKHWLPYGQRLEPSTIRVVSKLFSYHLHNCLCSHFNSEGVQGGSEDSGVEAEEKGNKKERIDLTITKETQGFTIYIQK